MTKSEKKNVYEGMRFFYKSFIFCRHAAKKKQFSTLLFGLRFTILCDEDLVQQPPPLENTIVKCIN